MILSKLCSPFLRSAARCRAVPQQLALQTGAQPVRFGSGGKRVMRIYRTKVRDRKWRSHVIRYTLIGAIPASLLIFWTSAIVGEAELYEYDPELYQPDPWEFYRHPIARFFAKYTMEDPKLSYYKDVYAIEHEKSSATTTVLIAEIENIERTRKRRADPEPRTSLTWYHHVDKLDQYAEEHGIENYRDDE